MPALPRFCFITDPDRTGGRPLHQVVERVLAGGCRMVQVRAPGLSDREFYLLARQLTHIIHGYGGLSLINDRADICHAIDADGVHLGANDLPAQVVRHLLGPDKLVGYSAHQLKELRRLPDEGIDYFTLSPIFPLTHKRAETPPWGIEGYREALLTTTLPVYALGGFSAETLPEFGAAFHADPNARVAAVSLVSETERISETTRWAIGQLLGADAPELQGDVRFEYDPSVEEDA